MWEFDPKKAALLVIDMQNDFVREGAVMEVPMARQALPNMRKIVEACRKAGVPVIYTQHVLYDHFEVSPLETTYNPMLKSGGLRDGTPGVEIVEELKPEPGEIVVRKHRYDAFYNTQMETLIRNSRYPHDTDTVIIVGTVTSVCCETTARSAFSRDFKVVFVSDANGGFDEASHNATLNSIRRVFGRVMSTDEVLAHLAKES